MGHWQDKNVGFLSKRGTVNRKKVVDERDGSLGAIETEHWDDRQDVNVFAKPVSASLKVNTEED